LDAHHGASDRLPGRFHAAVEKPVTQVAPIGEDREMVRVEQDHVRACRVLWRKGPARFLSASRTLRPSAKTWFIRSTPVKTPRVRRQFLSPLIFLTEVGLTIQPKSAGHAIDQLRLAQRQARRNARKAATRPAESR
jgi:hypothetical protein